MTYGQILNRLSKSKFRNSFKLKDKDILYIKAKGINTIKRHAHDIIAKRLSTYSATADGKHTPMRGHPVFIAQHATATCCRGCLYKWYRIDKKRDLTDKDINFIVNLIMLWIKHQI